MKKIYANLLGTWTDISNDLVDGKHAITYFEEELLTPINDSSKIMKLYEYDYLNIEHDNKMYRINPIYIQIVNE